MSEKSASSSGDTSNTRVSMLTKPELHIRADEERRLRTLVTELAKGIEDEDALLDRLGLTRDDFEELGQTKLFRSMLEAAQMEWAGAGNTHKRVRLKAAVNIEEAMPSLYNGMVDMSEPLSSRVKAFEIMAKIGGLGNPEPAAASTGSSFQLTIHLDGEKAPMVIEGSSNIEDYESEASLTGMPGLPALYSNGPDISGPVGYSQSKLFDDQPDDDL